ncbi:hypothetical protein K7X08_032623 [Anisodus acutangulus]|uniref:Uncharacterized protein n=1 Tax=Anisodus acutangulus TaxID=402998 RepID=A0A9Q1LY95_9SOLA|nr:hypothetical protein K7X08_032623 [Anisodus acutangulus]
MSVNRCVTKSGCGCGFLEEDNSDYVVDGQGVDGVTAPDSGGNKRPREAEDVKWDKRRRLKMMFYHVAKGLYLSQTKDPNYDCISTGSANNSSAYLLLEQRMLEVNKNSRVSDCPELDVPDLQDSEVVDYSELNVSDLQNSGILDVELRQSKEGTKTCSMPSNFHG